MTNHSSPPETTDADFGWKTLVKLAVVFIGSPLLLAGLDKGLEHYLNVTILGHFGPKFLTVLLVSFLAAATWLLSRQRAVLNEIHEAVRKTLQNEAKGLFRETLVHSVLEDAFSATGGGARHHERALHFLRALHQVDLKLAPGVEVVAQRHIEGLQNALRALQHETDEFKIRGDYQVRISEAFAKNCSKIIFFDTEPSEWSEVFSSYVDSLTTKSATKQQYLLCHSKQECDNPKSSPTLDAYIQKMERLGFQVFLVSVSYFTAAGLSDMRSRLEIYDSQVVFKIQSMHSFAGAEQVDMNVTLRTVNGDTDVQRILEILNKHRRSVPN